jgi:hypothetical protein
LLKQPRLQKWSPARKLADVHASLSHCVHFKVALWRNAEGIGDTIEEREHGSDIHRFGYLRFSPTVITKDLHVLWRRSVCCFGDLGDVVEQRSLSRVQASFVELAFRNRLNRLFFCSLNPQEVSVGVQSIRTAVKP